MRQLLRLHTVSLVNYFPATALIASRVGDGVNANVPYTPGPGTPASSMRATDSGDPSRRPAHPEYPAAYGCVTGAVSLAGSNCAS